MAEIRTVKEGRKTLYTDGNIKGIRVSKVKNMIAKPAIGWWRVKCSLNYMEEELLSLKEIKQDDIRDIKKQARGASTRESKEALGVGSQTHDLVEADLNNQPVFIDEYGEKVQNGFASYLDWKQEHDIEVLETEKALLYKTEIDGNPVAYGGRTDFIGYVDGRLMLGDWKTSKAIYPSYGLQVAAYKLAWEQLTGKAIDGLFVARLDKKTGIMEYKEIDNIENKEKAFLNLFEFTMRYKEGK